MTDNVQNKESSPRVLANLRKRQKAEIRFQWFGRISIAFGLACVLFLFSDIISKGYSAFVQTQIQIEIDFDEQELGLTPQSTEQEIKDASFRSLFRDTLKTQHPEITDRSERRELYALYTTDAALILRDMVLADPSIIGTKKTISMVADDDVDVFYKHIYGVSRLTEAQEKIVSGYIEQGRVTKNFNVSAKIQIEIDFDEQELGLTPKSKEQEIKDANDARFSTLFRNALTAQHPDIASNSERDELYALYTFDPVSILRDRVLADPSIIGTKQIINMDADEEVGVFYKQIYGVSRLNKAQQKVVSDYVEQGKVNKRFNAMFFSNTDSREPELAGIKGAIVGSILKLLVTLCLSFPIAVATAIYLEEFAPQNKITDFIEVNINNLAAVPSVIFGLLGLAIFINFFGLPRSVPLVGGFVLTLMTLPTIIISSRAAIKSVPPSIREAALGMGASKAQTILHHVLPLAMPGMLTGTIIGMAQALGETAPLLMIGMVAFIVDTPATITDPATVLPVQIFLWSDSPERSFVEKTSAAIMVLLAFLICMNSLAVWLRKRLERRW